MCFIHNKDEIRKSTGSISSHNLIYFRNVHLIYCECAQSDIISYSLSLREFQNAQTMVFAIEEINNSPIILPGMRLGYRIYDSCGSVEMAVRAALSLVNGQDYQATNTSCSHPDTVQVIIAETSSTPTIAISAAVGPLNIPVVGLCLICRLICFSQNCVVCKIQQRMSIFIFFTLCTSMGKWMPFILLT